MIVFLCLLSLALGEPPVRDSYLEAAGSLQDHGPHQQYIPDLTASTTRQNNHHHVPTSRLSQQTSGFRDNLSQVYGAPKNSRLSQEYGAPEFRDSLSEVYGTPNQGTFRSLSQEYGVPATSQYDNSFSSAPKSSVTHYGSPTSRNPSSSYLPAQRFTQYGSGSDLSRSISRNSSPVQKYGVPKFQSRESQFNSEGYGSFHPDITPVRSNNQAKAPSQFGRSLSSQYGIPEARNVFPEHLEKYGVPNARSISQEYGQPTERSIGSKTNAFTTYSSVKSPSQQYGLPQSRQVDSMPSNQYGVPAGVSDQGYQYASARNALDLLNQEPANYEFAYKVDDYESGSDFGHVETRQEDKAEGSYFVVLPDGTKQVVEYEADAEGFKPRISVQPADVDTRNAGPY